jgi:hypothetical protein
MHPGDSIRWQALVSAASAFLPKEDYVKMLLEARKAGSSPPDNVRGGTTASPLPKAKDRGICKALDDPTPCTLYTCTHDYKEGIGTIPRPDTAPVSNNMQ